MVTSRSLRRWKKEGKQKLLWALRMYKSVHAARYMVRWEEMTIEEMMEREQKKKEKRIQQEQSRKERAHKKQKDQIKSIVYREI